MKLFFFVTFFLFISQPILFCTQFSEHLLRGQQLSEQKKLTEATRAFNNALAFLPNNHSQQIELGNSLLNLANIFFKKGEMESALRTYKKIRNLFPNCWTVHYSIGMTCGELNLLPEAIESFYKAISINPNSIEVHLLLAIALLATGDYKNGWREYEWRWKFSDKKARQKKYLFWDGKKSLKGKTILLLSEGGLGDILQFVRYAQQIKQMGAHVILATKPSLKTLLSTCCPYIDEILIGGDKIPWSIDYQTSLMSLPHLLGTTITSVPVDIPYIHPPRKLVHFWRKKTQASDFAKSTTDKQNERTVSVGLCWQADPHNDKNRPPFARRSIPLKDFEQLTNISGITLFSLQQIDGLDQLNNLPDSFDITVFQNIDVANGPFMDTAAIIANLDLVITVDTAIAHLAGALGIKTFLLLPYKSDWRWMLNCNKTPWYPNMTLFRQTKKFDWNTPIQNVYNHLNYLDDTRTPWYQTT